MKYADRIDDAQMTKLMDRDYCLKNMSLHYPLFKEIPADATPEEIKEMCKDNKNKRRFGAKVYEFALLAGRKFLMTNDFYKDRIAKFTNAFTSVYGE